MDRFIIPVPGFAEPVASWLHLIAAVIALFGGYWLIARTRDGMSRWGIAVFVFGAVFLFSMSGTYHLLDPEGTPRAVLRRLDYAAIWTMIAGSLTAIHLTAFRDWLWRYAMPTVIWALAITGIVLKTVFFDELSEGVTLTLLLALGWMGFLSISKLSRLHGRELARPLISGGLVYTVGAVMDFVGHPILFPGIVGAHEIFHVTVIAGATIHAQALVALARHAGEASHTGASAQATAPVAAE